MVVAVFWHGSSPSGVSVGTVDDDMAPAAAAAAAAAAAEWEVSDSCTSVIRFRD